jgi:hypothetical protein
MGLWYPSLGAELPDYRYISGVPSFRLSLDLTTLVKVKCGNSHFVTCELVGRFTKKCDLSLGAGNPRKSPKLGKT